MPTFPIFELLEEVPVVTAVLGPTAAELGRPSQHLRTSR